MVSHDGVLLTFLRILQRQNVFLGYGHFKLLIVNKLFMIFYVFPIDL